jgi:hypothetical protein
MRQPPGFVDSSKPDHYSHLVWSLYGLKQAPRVWHACLSSLFGSPGFKPSATDTSLFILQCSDVTIFLLVYVNDIIVLSTSVSVHFLLRILEFCITFWVLNSTHLLLADLFFINASMPLSFLRMLVC